MNPIASKRSDHKPPKWPPNMAATMDERLGDALPATLDADALPATLDADALPATLDAWDQAMKHANDYEIFHRPSRSVLDKVTEANALEGWIKRAWTDAEGITRVETVSADITIRRKRR